MSLLLTDVQRVSLAISPKSAAGNPTAVDGAPAWSSSDDTVLTVEAAADGLSAVATTTGKLGTAQVRVEADADVGSGVTPLNAVLDVEVLASEAVALEVAAGTPESRV